MSVMRTSLESECPDCGTAGRLRSAVVWFNERPLHLPEIAEALGAAASSSPSAPRARLSGGGFVDLVPGHSIELNLAPSAVASHFAEAIYGPASETVPALVDRLLAVYAAAEREADAAGGR
jgi:NAD-dependent protein deacetylases, SIR2 family